MFNHLLRVVGSVVFVIFLEAHFVVYDHIFLYLLLIDGTEELLTLNHSGS